MKRDLLTILDLTREEIEALFDRTAHLKMLWRQGRLPLALQGKVVGLLFTKPSTRTRVSFEVAAHQLGASTIFLTSETTQLSRQETLADTARVLSRYIDALVVRTYADSDVEELARHGTIPVVNALTDLYHPCQVLSDLFTIKEIKGELYDLDIAWVGDGNNVAHSWINAAARLPLKLTLACPRGFEPRPEILERARAQADHPIRVVNDPVAAVAGADVINTDVWASMGQDEQRSQRVALFRDFQVNEALVAKAKPDAVVLHCLPAHRGEEITDEVMDGPQSVVFDQAENRMHFQRALLDWLFSQLGG